MSFSDVRMEVLEIKVEPVYDEEQNAVLDIKLMENHEDAITSPNRKTSFLESPSVPEFGKVKIEQEENYDEVTEKLR
ncbi:uncharacterized protein LOC143230990 [Tachypleus tridentatus]|uniref:uncharacterized protein LOC143230990 n=1 Tax=Tachypleus tridentatus TaxID=6853 RepID=UPI003FD1DFD8